MPIDAQSADDFDVPPLKRRLKNLAPFKIIVPFEIGELLRVYFDIFRQSSLLNFPPYKQSSFYIFGVLVDSRE